MPGCPLCNARSKPLQPAWVRRRCRSGAPSHGELMQQLRAHDKAGAEGLMLRRGDAPYRGGRSEVAQAQVLLTMRKAWWWAIPGRGKYAGQTGALLVQMPDGQRIFAWAAA